MADRVAGRILPIIAVPSVDATRNLYVDTLGFQHVMGMIGKDGHLDFCTVVLGAASIMFSRAPNTEAGARRQPVDIYLEVADVDALHDTLKKKGVETSDPLTLQWWGDRTFKVMDPNGPPTLPSRCRRLAPSSSERQERRLTMKLSAPFLQELAMEAATTRRVLERVPESRLAWRPHPKSTGFVYVSAAGTKSDAALQRWVALGEQVALEAMSAASAVARRRRSASRAQ